ncbi:uncharacterized protein LOC119090912 [Pollicipes pollicipes]|uniref:uncharacterized protein LOC119090912 n=1 Tax=Pollicipes pollicipes TaxID=41117 RepID=UPI0018851AF9|nr:uncharacterized protein LOC119090912 [Pollicipes pollicipes]
MFSKSYEQATFNVLHSLLHELQDRVPALVVWSSMLPESANFQQNVCLELKKVAHVFLAFRRECNDITHVGETLQAYYSNHVINVLCQNTPALKLTNSCCRR